MNRFHVSAKARADLKEIGRYVARDKVSAASRLRALFYDKFALLASQPLIGQDRVDLRPDMRAFSVGNYVVYFASNSAGVEIVRVLHSAREVGGAWN